MQESIIYQTEANLDGSKPLARDTPSSEIEAFISEIHSCSPQLPKITILHSPNAWNFYLGCLEYEISFLFPSIFTQLLEVNEVYNEPSTIISKANWNVQKSILNQYT